MLLSLVIDLSVPSMEPRTAKATGWFGKLALVGDNLTQTFSNSWTPLWGDHGYIKLFRADNEGDRCGTDITPEDGSGCAGGPSQVQVCGSCGILFDTVYPTLA